MKKVINYRNELKPKWSETGFLLFSILGIIMVFPIYKQYLDEKDPMILFALGIIILFSVFFALVPVMKSIEANKSLQRKAIIIKNGIKVSGKIKEIETDFQRIIGHDGGDNIVYYHYAIVNFVYQNEKKEIKTPELAFPVSSIKTKDVDVYIYNNEYYVDNFKIKYKKINKLKKKKKF